MVMWWLNFWFTCIPALAIRVWETATKKLEPKSSWMQIRK